MGVTDTYHGAGIHMRCLGLEGLELVAATLNGAAHSKWNEEEERQETGLELHLCGGI